MGSTGLGGIRIEVFLIGDSWADAGKAGPSTPRASLRSGRDDRAWRIKSRSFSLHSQLSEHCGLIGDDACDAEFKVAAHGWLAVDGPHKDLSACGRDFGEGGLRRQTVVQHDEARGKTGPCRQLALGVADQSEWNLRCLGVERGQDLRQKRRDYESTLGRELAQQRGRAELQAVDFEFDVEICAAGVAFQDFAQCWELEIGSAGAGYHPAAGFRVMANHRFAVAGEADVKLEAVAAVRQAEVKRCPRIFRDGFVGARAAVSEE